MRFNGTYRAGLVVVELPIPLNFSFTFILIFVDIFSSKGSLLNRLPEIFKELKNSFIKLT